ncbi:MAG: hypothetical protein NTZ56_21625 [Acidobacteria bacterium]|nr:hypothetical protein [Acidobacteriota bacterium]
MRRLTAIPQPARNRRGVALIMVLWLTAALGVIAFSVAQTVLGEVRRAENTLDAARAGFLARAGIERTYGFLRYGYQPLPNQLPLFEFGQQRILHHFPGGDVWVEILPETGKLSLLSATPDQLLTLLLRIRMEPAAAANFVQTLSTFRTSGASLRQIEELFLFPGMNPSLFYGGLDRLPGGALVERPGLRDVLSLYGGTTMADANSARPEVMETLGVPPPAAMAVVTLRQRFQLRPVDVERLGLSKVLRTGPDQAYTIRATARPRTANGQLSDFRRTVSALVVYELDVSNQQVPRLKNWDESAVAETPWP